jgi:2-polyprenyl-3-methyl-5-hydroxy-6-metoxy-1,4-benzoquinol methylase
MNELKINMYQISYSEDTFKNVSNGFLVLDNLNNERPDWMEYWPMRKFLLTNVLDENSYYGFFSPKFQQKTGHNAETFKKACNSLSENYDVIFCSPQPEVGCFFKNVYYGSDRTDPGALDTYDQVYKNYSSEFNIKNIIGDSSNTIYSNYFIAKPIFWREWLKFAEYVFNLAENGSSRLRDELNFITPYGDQTIPRKVFLIEGIVSILLITLKKYTYYSIPLFPGFHSGNIFEEYQEESRICDFLKKSYKNTGSEKFLKYFNEISESTILNLINKRSDNKMENTNKKNTELSQTPAHDLYNDTIYSVLKEFKPNTITEVGCMRGTLARKFKELNEDCHWIGIDIDSDNVIESDKICDIAILADIEAYDESHLKIMRPSDMWVFGDVLEHLKNPWKTLEKIKINLSDNGRVVACIPNSQNWNFQARINSGMMHYQEDGLFDKTHLRFFSRLTMIDLFQSVGYEIENIYARVFNFPGQEKYIPHIRAMAEVSGVNPDQAEKDALVFQYVIVAKVKK